jgi:type VI secretion system secreted protein VgrG
VKQTQDNKLIQIDTPLGKDVLLLKSFAGSESISRLFSFSAELLSEDPSIAFDKIVGQRVNISIMQVNGDKRYINGFVSRFSQTGADSRFTHYHAEVVPWLWFLTRSAACRIFQNMTVPDIIAKVFSGLSCNDFKKSLQGTYGPWEYCVQYRETAFNFVSRLMEQEGIFYFFEHEKDKHTLVLADRPGAHKPCPFTPKGRLDFSLGGVVKEDVIQDWQMEQELRTGKYFLRDYNFETPSTDLSVNEPSAITVDGNTKYEIYDYPGEYSKKDDGQTIVKTRMQEEETTNLLATGSSDCRGFVSGFRFDLDGHPRKDMNKSYTLTEVHHSATVSEVYANETSGGGDKYSNHFSCIPQTVQFRPARHTPKPFVQGPQTAVIVGKKGEEIWVDKYGRVKIQFFWDREGKKDENSSCWVRVSQQWAGKNWGAMWIPRMGQEVIVSFLEGDPDQPIITGRVYNAEQMPPYALPDNQTRSTYMSRSSQGGSSSNYNEIRFEDKIGSEQIFINAEYDMDHRVEHDSREFVGNDRHLSITGNQVEQVGKDRNEQVGGDHNEAITGNKSLNITGNSMESITGASSINITQGLDEKIGTNFSQATGQNLYIKAGMNLTIEAGVQLSLVVGGNFVTIGPAGVAITGTMVMINSGGAAGSGTPANPQAPKDPIDPDIADDGTKGTKLS